MLSKNTPRPYSLSCSLSLSVFSLCESKSALFITPHDESSMPRLSALRRKDIESMMHDFNACKPTKKFGTRLFKDDARVYATITRATAFVKQRPPTLSRERYTVCGTITEMHSCRQPFFVVFFSVTFSIKFALRKTQNSSWYVSLVVSLSRSLSL